jgi:hypothetical protein
MASTLTAIVTTQVAGVETFDGLASSADNTVTYSGLSESNTYDGSTSVPVTKQAAFEKALSSGSGTIDLTALPGKTADETVNFNGLRVQALKLRNKSTNANSITIAQGGSNAWTGLGSTFSLTLLPGQAATLEFKEGGPDVGSSVKNIALTGTGAQILEVHAIAG